MMPVLWTGTGSARTQAGYNFQPDLLWIMRRDASGMSVRLHDVVRGDNGTVMYRLQTNGANSEDTDTDVTGLTSTGFTIGNDGSDHPNILNATYVGWGWKAAQNSGSSNTTGSITSTVSANPSAGFSIVKYTGAGAGSTIGHGLGVQPSLLIIKNRDAAEDWVVYVKGVTDATAHKYLALNLTGAIVTSPTGSNAIFNGTEPTSTVFSVHSNNRTGASGNDYIAYCFAEVEGYSKFGSYTGNGNADGPFVYCGFRPAWILIKRTDSSQSWNILDTARTTYNPSEYALFPDDSFQENYSANYGTDILSNGFKLRTQYYINLSGGNYIFAAFAENPFGGDSISPATAR
jgi:hypothetical protein